jgi:hypothetical protein
MGEQEGVAVVLLVAGWGGGCCCCFGVLRGNDSAAEWGVRCAKRAGKSRLQWMAARMLSVSRAATRHGRARGMPVCHPCKGGELDRMQWWQLVMTEQQPSHCSLANSSEGQFAQAAECMPVGVVPGGTDEMLQLGHGRRCCAL